MKKFAFVLSSSWFLVIPFVSAYGFSDTISNIMYQIQSFFSRPEIQGMVAFFSLFMILLAVFRLALGKVPLFKGQARQLNAVAIGFSLLSVFGIFFAANRSFEEVARIIFTYGGKYGALLLGSVVGITFYYFFKDQITDAHWTRKVGVILIAIGLALMTMGILYPN